MKLIQLLNLAFVASFAVIKSDLHKRDELLGATRRRRGGDNGGNNGGDTGDNNGGDTGGNNGGDTGDNNGGDTGGNGGETGGSTSPQTGDGNNNGNRGGDNTGNSGSSTTQQDSSYDGIIFLLSHLLILIGGAVMTAYASGKVQAVTSPTILAVGGAGLGSVASFLVLYFQQLVSISTLVQAIIILIVGAGVGYMVYSKKNEMIGSFGLGAMLGYVIALLIALVLGNTLGGDLIRPLFLGIVALGFGYLVMNGAQPKFLIISCAIAGAFALVYGLDSFLFKSGFSQIGDIALNSRVFPGFQGTYTVLAYILFVVIAGACLYLQKAKLTSK